MSEPPPPGYGPPPDYGESPGYGPPPAYGQPPGYGPSPVYGQPGYGQQIDPRGYGRPEHAPGALASLILGVIGLTAVPFIGSIIALVLGYQSRAAAKAEPWRYHDGLGKVGRILGWIGVVLPVLAVLAFFLVLLRFGFS
jgi:hypothetical protein